MLHSRLLPRTIDDSGRHCVYLNQWFGFVVLVFTGIALAIWYCHAVDQVWALVSFVTPWIIQISKGLYVCGFSRPSQAKQATLKGEVHLAAIWKDAFGPDYPDKDVFVEKVEATATLKNQIKRDLGDVYDVLQLVQGCESALGQVGLSRDKFVKGMLLGYGDLPADAHCCTFFGAIRSGKTTLVETLTEKTGAENADWRESMEGATEQLKVHDLRLPSADGKATKKTIYLIDTPGLGHKGVSLSNTLNELDKLRPDGSRIIFVHDATQESFSVAEDVFKQVSEDTENNMTHAYLVLTKWDMVHKRKKEINNFVWLAKLLKIPEANMRTSSIPFDDDNKVIVNEVDVENIRLICESCDTPYTKIRAPSDWRMTNITEGIDGGTGRRCNQRACYFAALVAFVIVVAVIFALGILFYPCNNGQSLRSNCLWSVVTFRGRCAPAVCNIQNSDRRPGTACRCLDAFVGNISWDGPDPKGKCSPAPCNIPHTDKLPGKDCSCKPGYGGLIKWSGPQAYGSCSRAPCVVPNAMGLGPTCRCLDGFSGRITWSGAKPSGRCIPVACAVKHSNRTAGPGCSCKDGFAGDISWRRAQVSGTCDPAPCRIYGSNEIAGPNCACKPDYQGIIAWSGPNASGLCDIICPPSGFIHTWRRDGVTTCTRAPCHVANSNRLASFRCRCLDGFAGSITWAGPTPSGPCTPVRCGQSHTIGVYPHCRCADGFSGEVKWQGAMYTSTCQPAYCAIHNAQGAGLDCTCSVGYYAAQSSSDPHGGRITWSQDVAHGYCQQSPPGHERGYCFPGQALVTISHVYSTDDAHANCTHVPIKRLRTGDRVLAEGAKGELVYERVLGFLHVLPHASPTRGFAFWRVRHTTGDFRASASHFVFVVREDGTGRHSVRVSELRVGDWLLSVGNATAQGIQRAGLVKFTMVLELEVEQFAQGMYAPLTASGTIVVDGVVASIYAGPTWVHYRLRSHNIMHAFVFPFRCYHCMSTWLFGDEYTHSTGWLGGPEDVSGEYLHPYIRNICMLFA